MNLKTMTTAFLCLLAFQVSAQLAVTINTTEVTCNGGSNGTASLTITGGLPPYAVQWSNGSTFVNQTGLAAGNYSATVTDANNASVTEMAMVTEPSPVEITPSASVSFCEGDSATLNAVASGGVGPYNYFWVCGSSTCSLSDATIANPVAKPTASRTYEVLATDARLCSSPVQTVTVTVSPNPTVDAGADVSIFEGNSIRLQATPTWLASYSWTPFGNSIPDPLVSPTETTTFVLVASNVEGCTATDSVTVTVSERPPLDENRINNLFTPNGDGANDTWMINGLDAVVDVSVYNRWGNLVYEQKNYQNNWDGTNEGEPLPDGTYYYQVTIGGQSELTGAVSILRLEK